MIRPAIPTDAFGHLVTDVSCVACGYNLRGLSPSGNCPECNAAISASAFRSRLIFAEPEWIQKMVRGFNLFFGGLVSSIITFVLLLIVRAFLRTAGYDEQVISAITWGAGMMSGLVIAWGGFLLTSRETKYVDEPDFSPRQTLRLSGAVTVMMATLTGPAAIISDSTSPIMLVLSCIALAFTGFAALKYGEKLARRIPSVALVISVRWLRVACIAFTVIFGMYLAGWVMQHSDWAPLTVLATTLTDINAVLIVRVFGLILLMASAVVAFALMVEFRSIFRASVRDLNASSKSVARCRRSWCRPHAP